MAAVNADRNLLFGLLALQNGLIDQDQLVAAFRAWSRDKGRQIAEYLVERGDLNADQRGAIQVMVGLHEKKHGGSAVKSLAAIPAGRSTRESLAAVGDREIEGTLAHVGSGAAPSVSDFDADPTTTLSVGSGTSDGQRFRILRPHARGGLGAVFVALDGELHREAALKQILEKHADDAISRQRFVAEAEITGGLEHPGVVPVYGLGTDGDGRPYYAMRFIKGDSLKEAIARFHENETQKADPGPRSLDLRKLLRRFTDVCNAVDYAHSRGVIHRDLKPANIIVGKHGETLVVDWGLAKVVGRADRVVAEQTLAPSSGGSSETLPGSALGTPASMSPEQARGELNRLGPRSDVYSLGATLYCLLTGTPPFEGEDIGLILRNVQEGNFQRPCQRDPTLDKALEAICIKAMAHRPEDRYTSCRALADDLDRWMADEPVTAWREPFSRRARRWARRNRTAVTAASVALIAGLVGLSAVLAVQTQAKAELAASLKRETTTNAALTRSQSVVQARYDLAVEAIKKFHTGVSEDFLLKQEQFKDVRDRLLKAASDFYGKLGACRKDEAMSVFRKARADQEALAAAPEATAESRLDLTDTIIGVATVLADFGKLSDAEAELRTALAIRQKLADDSPAVLEFRSGLADSHNSLGLLLAAAGKTSAAEAEYRKALTIQQVLADDNPSVTGFQASLADSLVKIGWLLVRSGKPAAAIEYFLREEAIWKKVVDANPTILSYKNGLANCQTNVATVLLRLGRPAEARREQAIALREVLVREHPSLPRYRKELAESLLRLGQARQADGEPVGASTNWRRSIALFERVPNLDGEYVFFYACSHAALSSLAGQHGTGVSDGERDAEADQAMALLHRAAGMGYRAPATYRTETALDPLRGRTDFQLLLLDLAFPKDAFARGR